MTATNANFRVLNPITATVRQIAEVLNNTVAGKLNCTGEITLTGDGSDITVINPRASENSVILFEPQGLNYYSHEPFIKTKSNGSFVVGQKNNGHVSVIGYVIIG
jgi:hypothetical protein